MFFLNQFFLPNEDGWTRSRERQASVKLPELPLLLRHRMNSDQGTAEWVTMTDLPKHEAEVLLDWLENHQLNEREVRFQANGQITVRWKNPR